MVDRTVSFLLGKFRERALGDFIIFDCGEDRLLVVDAEAMPNLLAIDELAVDVLDCGESCEIAIPIRFIVDRRGRSPK